MVNKINATGRFLLLCGFFCLLALRVNAQITVRFTNETIKHIIESI